MKKKQHVRWIGLILSLVLCISMVPIEALATESQNFQEEQIQQLETLVEYEVSPVHPEYAEETREILEQEADAAVFLMAEEEPEYLESKEEAAALLREAMKRKETQYVIHLQVAGTEIDSTTTESRNACFLAIAREIWNQAFAHTGVSDEGDYLFWQWGGTMKRSVGGSVDGDIYKLDFTYTIPFYYTTLEQEAEVTEVLQNAEAQLHLSNLSEIDKIKAIYRYICQNVTYDYEHLPDSTYYLKHTAYAAAVQHTSVCQGYALMFYRMALDSGLDSRLVSGYSRSGEAHGWNIVAVDNAYYYIDTTWDACAPTQEPSGRNYLKGTYSFYSTHVLASGTDKLAATSTDLVSGYYIPEADYGTELGVELEPYTYEAKYYAPVFDEVSGVSASEINQKAMQIIALHEGGYTEVQPDDSGALAIGKLQWRGNRALQLMRMILAAFSDSADLETAYNILGKDLYDEIINGSTNWSDRILETDGAEQNALTLILGTPLGQITQDILAESDIYGYLNHGYNLGIQNPAALLYFAELENQYGSGNGAKCATYAKNIALDRPAVTLNELHTGAICYTYDHYNGSGILLDRRRSTYSFAVAQGWPYCNPGDYTMPYDTDGKKGAAWIQAALNEYQNAGLVVDGQYGANTKTAVKKFQTEEGLTADGWAGRDTSSLLIYRLYSELAQTGVKPVKDQWIASNGRWWYRHADGSYTRSNWEYINGKWYYFDASGWMKTGWLQLNGKWYYLTSSGAMATGWVKVGTTWYYMAASGAMQTGWLQLNGKWYYLTSSGAMATGWIQLKGSWYYLNTSGVMVTGWQTIGGKYYYFYSSGVMASQTWIGNYYVNASGVWTQTRNK